MSEENQDIPMAQCGACGSIVPLDSESCPNCGVRFGGVTDEVLGECGACGAIIPADSESCSQCGASFIELEVSTRVDPAEDIEEVAVSDNLDELNDIILPETEPETEVADEEDHEVEEVAIEEPEAEEFSEEDSADEEADSDVVAEETSGDEVDIDSLIDDVEEALADEMAEVAESKEEVEEEQTTTNIDQESEDGGEGAEEESDAEDSEELESDDSEQEDDSIPDEEKEEDDGIDDGAVAMAFDNLALAIADSGMTAAEAFGTIDTSDDQMIDAPELQKGIEKIAGEKLSPKHVTAILNHLDKDGNRRVDPAELIKALEDLRIGIQPGKMPKIKTFPSPTQKFLMGKKANDIVYPIAYFLMVTFIGLWVVNGVGLLVDGTGGTIVYEGGVDQFGDDIEVTNWNLCTSDALEELPDPCFGTVAVGETYPCDPAIDENKCANSLTPFSGENGSSSMPADFYNDGIAMIALGVIGLGITAYLHLIYAPSLRDRVREKSGKVDSEDSEEEEESDEEEEESALEAPKDLQIGEDTEDDDEYEDDDDDDSDDDDDEDYEDDIDVGDWIGIEVDGEEFFGEIVEFDDDEGTVTIETEDGEEITGDQDDMFLEDEDDE